MKTFTLIKITHLFNAQRFCTLALIKIIDDIAVFDFRTLKLGGCVSTMPDEKGVQ